MSTQWYVTVEGEQKGPLTDTEIRRWVSDGRISRETFVRTGADGKWRPAGDYNGLWPDETAAMLKQLSALEEQQDEEEPPEALPTDDEAIRLIQPSFAPGKKTRASFAAGKRPRARQTKVSVGSSVPGSLRLNSDIAMKLIVSVVLFTIGVGFLGYGFNLKADFDKKDARALHAYELVSELEYLSHRLTGSELEREPQAPRKADRMPFYVCITIGCVFIGHGLLPLALLGVRRNP